jgi:hypothetical protein
MTNQIERLVSWRWWNEKVIPVYEGNWYEWIAPRWYVVVVMLAYLAMFSMMTFGFYQLAVAN